MEDKKNFPKRNFGKKREGGTGPKKFRREERERPEFEQKMIDLRRVARVMAGGRRFTFRASLVIGDKNGRVGLGLGKAADTTLAIEKAYNQAKKNMIKVPINKYGSIPHEVYGKFGSGKIILKPAVAGRGLVAGTSCRTVLDLAGVKNATAKVLSRTKNKLNNARATMEALMNLKA